MHVGKANGIGRTLKTARPYVRGVGRAPFGPGKSETTSARRRPGSDRRGRGRIRRVARETRPKDDGIVRHTPGERSPRLSSRGTRRRCENENGARTVVVSSGSRLVVHAGVLFLRSVRSDDYIHARGRIICNAPSRVMSCPNIIFIRTARQ